MITAAEQIVHRRELARHEAAHASAFVMAGVMPANVHVTVNDHEAHGAVTINRDDLTGTKALVSLLAGFLALGEPPPSWPVVRGKSADENQIADLIDQLGMGREEYRATIRATYRAIASEEHCALENAFAHVLESTPVIDRAGIKRVVDIVARHREGGELMEKMIEIVGRDGETQVVPASARFWWEEDEAALAAGVQKAFDTRGAQVAMRNGKASELPIKVKRSRSE